MEDKTNLANDVTDFLIAMGIPKPDQSPDYRLEIAYRMGYEDALRNYAIWKNGENLRNAASSASCAGRVQEQGSATEVLA